MALTAALFVVPVISPLPLIGAAEASSGTWGPGSVPYDNGVICRTGSVSSALVSWPGTAFALGTVQDGGGHADVPDSGGVAVPLDPSASGIESASAAEMAYLIERHGSDASPAVVAEVADGVLQLAGAGAAEIDECLAQGTDGATQAAASDLVAQAGRLAGPYTVDVSGPTTPTTSGKPVPVVVHVTSATGYPVPGLAVQLTASDPHITLSAASTTTDSDGDVHLQATTPANTLVQNPTVTATVQGVAGLLETSAPGEVPLVKLAAPSSYRDSLALAIDTKPDPKLTLTNSQSVLLTGGDLTQTLGVTGMNGHAGTATVSLYGPLALPSGGCSAHTRADWAAARAAGKLVAAPQLIVTADGSFTIAKAAGLQPGCYQASAKLQTTDASPNVSATTTGDVVTVAPVSVHAAPAHDGLAPVGALQTTLSATSSLASTWQDVHGELLGPRLATAGKCPTTGWDSTATAGDASASGASTSSTGDGSVVAGTGTASPGSPPSGSSGSPTSQASQASQAQTQPSDTAAIGVASSPVNAAGCYAFTLVATLNLPGIGSTTLSIPPGTQSTPVHVISPVVSVSSLSQSGVDSGGRVSAVVHVNASDGQPGSLRLQLLRLPYTYRGCFGADWQQATVVGSTSAAPARTTDGDNTYRVDSAAVPGSACWTVVPVFTATANPAVRAQAVAGADPMLAFTSRRKPTSDELVSSTPRIGDGFARELGVGIGVSVIVVGLLGAIAAAARRDRRAEAIDPRDRLLS